MGATTVAQQRLAHMLSSISLLRRELEAMVGDRTTLSDPQVVRLSGRLDAAINEYYRASISLKAATDPS